MRYLYTKDDLAIMDEVLLSSMKQLRTDVPLKTHMTLSEHFLRPEPIKNEDLLHALHMVISYHLGVDAMRFIGYNSCSAFGDIVIAVFKKCINRLCDAYDKPNAVELFMSSSVPKGDVMTLLLKAQTIAKVSLYAYYPLNEESGEFFNMVESKINKFNEVEIPMRFFVHYLSAALACDGAVTSNVISYTLGVNIPFMLGFTPKTYDGLLDNEGAFIPDFEVAYLDKYQPFLPLYTDHIARVPIEERGLDNISKDYLTPRPYFAKWLDHLVKDCGLTYQTLGGNFHGVFESDLDSFANFYHTLDSLDLPTPTVSELLITPSYPEIYLRKEGRGNMKRIDPIAVNKEIEETIMHMNIPKDFYNVPLKGTENVGSKDNKIEIPVSTSFN